MQLIMITEPAIADALATNNRSNMAAKAILQITDELRLKLRPQFRGVNDAELKRYFVIEAPNANTATKALRNLQTCDGIEAVYQKPPDELPS